MAFWDSKEVREQNARERQIKKDHRRDARTERIATRQGARTDRTYTRQSERTDRTEATGELPGEMWADAAGGGLGVLGGILAMSSGMPMGAGMLPGMMSAPAPQPQTVTVPAPSVTDSPVFLIMAAGVAGLAIFAISKK